MGINPLVLSFPNFTLNQIIDPDEANQNNSDITSKVNDFISDVDNVNIAIGEHIKDTSVIVTTLEAGINDEVTSIEVADNIADFPVSGRAIIIDDDGYEVFKYTGKDGNILTGVTRGFYGTAQAWDAGKEIGIFYSIDDLVDVVDAALDAKADVTYVDTEIENVTLGQIPDGSIVDAKLSDEAGQIKARFDDHSARHENGGADVISIAGLAGESVNLAAHKLKTAPHSAAETLQASTQIEVTSTDDATSTTAAPLKTAGGLGVAKRAFFGEELMLRSNGVLCVLSNVNYFNVLHWARNPADLATGKQLRIRFTVAPTRQYMFNLQFMGAIHSGTAGRNAIIDKTFAFKQGTSGFVDKISDTRIIQTIADAEVDIVWVNNSTIDLIIKHPTVHTDTIRWSLLMTVLSSSELMVETDRVVEDIP